MSWKHYTFSWQFFNNLKIDNFSQFVDKKVAALAYHESPEEIVFLAEQGIMKLINLCSEEVLPWYAREAEARGIEVISVRINDFQESPPTQVTKP